MPFFPECRNLNISRRHVKEGNPVAGQFLHCKHVFSSCADFQWGQSGCGVLHRVSRKCVAGVRLGYEVDVAKSQSLVSICRKR